MSTNVERRVYSLSKSEGEARSWMGGLAIIKASGRDTDGRFSLVDLVDHEGLDTPLHVHHNEDEAFWILEGSLTFEVGVNIVKANPGSFLFGPKGVPHRYHVDKGPGRFIADRDLWRAIVINVGACPSTLRRRIKNCYRQRERSSQTN